MFKENDIPKAPVTDVHMYYVSQIYTQKQELIAVEFSELIAFNFVGGRLNIKMVWTNVNKKAFIEDLRNWNTSKCEVVFQQQPDD